MAELHIDLRSAELSIRWAAEDDDDFDSERVEREMLAARRELYSSLADLDAA